MNMKKPPVQKSDGAELNQAIIKAAENFKKTGEACLGASELTAGENLSHGSSSGPSKP